MKIYTRTGDGGETGLWGGGRISKDAARIHAYGTIDECNAAIGAARTFKPDPELDKMLEIIQSRLFVAGADLATPGDKETAIERIKNKDAAELEGWIDRLEESLPKLKQFIIPGGTSVAASLHLARTVCRRAERWAVTLVSQDETHRPALVFLNRLSDFLFVAARKANHSAGLVDLYWQKPQGKAGS